jgi:branched-chain amino acid transport system substrate-binding protein
MTRTETTGRPRPKRRGALAASVAPLAIVAAIAVSACGSSNSNSSTTSGSGGGSSASSTPYNVGLASILTGPAAVLGSQLNGGMDAFVKNLNASGGVNGKQINVDTADAGLVTSATIQALKTLVETDHDIAVGGLLDSSGAEGAHSVIEALKTTVLEATPVEQDVRPQAGPYFYGGGGPVYPDNAHLQVQFAQQHVLNGASNVRVALIYDISSSATEYGQEVKKLAAQNGWKVVAEQPYQVGTTAFSSQAATIAAAKPTIIFASFDPSNFAFIKALQAAGVTAPLISDQGGPTAAQLLELKYPGLYVQSAYAAYDYATSTNSAVKQYVQLVKKYGGGVDPGSNVTQYGYVEGEIMAAVLKQCGANCTTAKFVSTIGQMHSIPTNGFTFAPITYSPANTQGVPTNAFFTYSGSKVVQEPGLYSYPAP